MGAVHADGIVSSDIVGYNTESLTGGKLNVTGIMFVTPDGSDIDLNSGNVTIANLTAGADDTESDLILVWNPATSAYTTYYFYDEEGAEAEDVRWWDAGGESEPVFPAGTAFWYKAKPGTGKSITVSGAIASDATETFSITGGKLNMCINPYPVDIDLNSSNVTIANLTAGADDTESDLVLVWNPATSAYTTYYYYDEEGAEAEDVRWWDAGGESEPIITAGAGFWYKAKSGNGKSITFKSPIK